MSDPTSTPDRRQRRREATRHRLVVAAQDLLADDGLAFGVQQVADRADVALATLYNHFATKQDLVLAAAADAALRVEAYLEDVTAGIDDPLGRLAMRGRLHGRLHESHPKEARVLLATALHVASFENAMRSETMRLAELASAERGLDDETVRLTALMAYATTQHLLAHQLAGSHHGPGDVDRLVALLLRLAGLSDADAERLAHAPLPTQPKGPRP